MVLSQASIEGLRCWRAVLLAGTSALGLQAVAPQASAQPAPPGLYVTLEGGAACGIGGGSTISSGVQIGTVFPPLASTTIGDDLCGWMGRAGISQYKPGMLGGLLDSWGFFWREQTPSGNVHARGDIDSTGRYRNAFSADAREHRSVLDFEAGKDLGIGGADTRLMGGLRYARFDSKTKLSGIYTDAIFPAQPYFFNADIRSKFEGFGPRIGMSLRLPIGAGLSLMLDGSGAALYGERVTTIAAVHAIGARAGGPVTDLARSADNGWVLNLAGEAALAIPLFGGGTELQLGARAEGWFDQVTGAASGATCTAAPQLTAGGCTKLSGGDRHEITPFVRLKIKLD